MKPAISTKPVFSRSWTDAFGTVFIHLEGGTGDQTVLLLCPLEHGQTALNILETLPWFKGRITLAVFAQNHSTPIQAAVRFLEPKVIIALDAESIISSGDALHLETQVFTSNTGIEYTHGGEFPAWHSSLGIKGIHGSSLMASFASSSLHKILACPPQELDMVLKTISTT
jgi:hypothetical protein